MYPYIKLFGFDIPTYGLCICFAVFLCAILVFKKGHETNIDYNDLMVLSAVSIGCGMLGGVFLYIFVTYDFITLCKQIVVGNLSFLQNPGIVFYGGLIGGISGGLITAKLLDIKIEDVEKCIIPYIPLGHAIGRVGCLLAGCCHGFTYDGLFAVSKTAERITYFPIQIVESMLNLLIMTVLLLCTKKERTPYSLVSLYVMMYSLLRFCLEFFRGDVIRGQFLFFSTSQWISLILFLSSVIAVVKIMKQALRRAK